MRRVSLAMDLLIGVSLFAVLAIALFLFLGAFSAHRLAILFNGRVLRDVEADIGTALVQGSNTVSVSREAIKEFRDAQNELFDVNTVAFLFQFVTLMLVTIGGALLGLVYKAYRESESKAHEVDSAHEKMKRQLGMFVRDRNITLVLAVKYSALYLLVHLFRVSRDKQRERIRDMMTDFQHELLEQLQEVTKGRAGFEQCLFDYVLYDSADESLKELKELNGEVWGVEQEAVERILAESEACLGLLEQHGPKFMETYKSQLAQITGDEV